jgi:hypothetical protein
LAPGAGLDPSIVVAQSAEETGNWTSRWWRERLNPAGIGITGDANENAASRTWDTGADAARAHLVHLFVYAVGAVPDGNPLAAHRALDPRYQLALDATNPRVAGQAPTIDGLTGTWATDPAYAAKIAQRGNAIFPNLGVPPPEFVPFPAVRVFHAQQGAVGRERPTRAAPVAKHFEAGATLNCDGFFHGQFVAEFGDDRWLRTTGPQPVAIHTSGVVESI